jgi:hypothetical protein
MDWQSKMSHIINIYNHELGTLISREMTQHELAEFEQGALEVAKKQEQEAILESKKLSALAKLEALGLSLDDLETLGLLEKAEPEPKL